MSVAPSTTSARGERLSRIGPKERARHAAARSRTIRWLKVAFPVIGAVLLVATLAWPMLRGGIEKIGAFLPILLDRAPGDYQIFELSMKGTNDENEPYVVTAKTAVKFDPDVEEIELRSPTADMTTAGGSWLAVMADDGLYRPDDDLLELYTNVNLFHDDGYEINGSNVTVDFDKSLAFSNDRVHGHGEFGTLDGTGFEVRDRGRVVRIHGPARVVIFPDAGDGQ